MYVYKDLKLIRATYRGITSRTGCEGLSYRNFINRKINFFSGAIFEILNIY
jgi:hypothetical protein